MIAAGLAGVAFAMRMSAGLGNDAASRWVLALAAVTTIASIRTEWLDSRRPKVDQAVVEAIMDYQRGALGLEETAQIVAAKRWWGGRVELIASPDSAEAHRALAARVAELRAMGAKKAKSL